MVKTPCFHCRGWGFDSWLRDLRYMCHVVLAKKKKKKKIFRKRQKREKRREKEEERQRVSGNVSFLPVTDITWRLSLPPSWEVRWRQ